MKKKGMRSAGAISVVFLFAAMIFTKTIKLDAADAVVDTWIPVEYQTYCEQIGAQYSISPELLEAMMEQESSGKPQVHNGNCKGLMQINEQFHKPRMIKLGVTNIYDPYSNILVAADYMQELFETYEDMGTVLMIYNGSSNAVEMGENGTYTEYATVIMNRTEVLERLHGK
jgi:soluble lytic murein transglycosylase-like protein